jgi:hypothetical protein
LDRETSKAIDAVERLFSLVDEEGLNGHILRWYELPAHLYYSAGDLEKALEYNLKLRHELDAYGVPEKHVEEMIEMYNGIISRLERDIRDRQEERRTNRETSKKM